MNTKKAIELIEHVSWNAFGNYGYDNNREEMIELLKRGEKYKEMWKKLRDIYLPDPKVDEGLLKRIMDGIERKYFPKPNEKLVGLMKKIDEEVKKIIKELGG